MICLSIWNWPVTVVPKKRNRALQNMSARQKIEPLCTRLGITSEKAKRKAEEFVRRLDAKAPMGIKSTVTFIKALWQSRLILANMLCVFTFHVNCVYSANYVDNQGMKCPLIAPWPTKQLEWILQSTETRTSKSPVFFKSSMWLLALFFIAKNSGFYYRASSQVKLHQGCRISCQSAGQVCPLQLFYFPKI